MSTQLLEVLLANNITVSEALDDTLLSPSFYLPSNLLQLSPDFIHLAAQFNCLKAWTLIPEYTQRCHEYFEQPREKKEYLLFTKALLERNHLAEAKRILQKTVQFQWPETHRYQLKGNYQPHKLCSGYYQDSP